MEAVMERPFNKDTVELPLPPPLTAEAVKRARAQVEAIREQIRRRGVDLSQLPDPVEALSRAREQGNWE
jgi:hypothetical protein